jgi:uncharacterized protein (TIGR03435 family)
MARLTSLVASWIVFAVITAAAQRPTFEVASVRPNASGESGGEFTVRPGGQLAVRNMTVKDLLRNSFGFEDYRIVSGPDWMTRDRFDIAARTPDGTDGQIREMVQSLLADRFKLAVHTETREMPAYALRTVNGPEKLGPQMRPPALDCGNAAARAGAPMPDWPPGRPTCGTRAGRGRFIGAGAPLANLARNLSDAAGRVIVDETGLSGRYDLLLEWNPDQSDADTPSLFAAIREQLGLKLEPVRAPVEVLIVDRVERPTPD